MRSVSIAALLALAACSGQPAPSVDTACAWTRQISVRQADVLTDETAREVLAYDRARKANCP